jgi:uncharacterized membrane protein HdeD (DUF308 family)
MMLVQALLMILMGSIWQILPDKKTGDYQTWITVIAFLIGVLSVLAYFGASRFEKSCWELIKGLLSLAVGICLLFTYRFDPVSPRGFFILMFLHALMYANAYLYERDEAGFWWLIFYLVEYTLLLMYGIISGETFRGQSVLMLGGLQYIFCGITTLFFVFVIRRVQIEFNKPISDFRLGNPFLKCSTK